MVKIINKIISSCHIRKDDRHFNIIRDNSSNYFEARALEAIQSAQNSNSPSEYEKDMKLAIRLIAMALNKRPKNEPVSTKENESNGTGISDRGSIDQVT